MTDLKIKLLAKVGIFLLIANCFYIPNIQMLPKSMFQDSQVKIEELGSQGK